jgi:hypothetical protein
VQALWVQVAIAIGIVGPMFTKPGSLGSPAIVAVAAMVGLLLAL